MIIDFHTHVFPDAVAPKAIASLVKSGGIPAYSDATARGLRGSMKQAGIDRSLILPIATKPSQTPSINRFAVELNGKDGLYSFGSVHPLYGDWRGELKRIRQAGLKGIKLHPDFQGFFVDDPQMVEVIAQAGREGLCVLLHSGMDFSFLDVHHTTPERVANILPQIGDTTLILAHLGGYNYLDDVEKYLMDGRVYIDTSYSIGKADDAQVRRILNHYPQDKILFGSDSPWDDQSAAVRAFLNLGFSAKRAERILWKNAAELLGI